MVTFSSPPMWFRVAFSYRRRPWIAVLPESSCAEPFVMWPVLYCVCAFGVPFVQ